MLPEQPEVHNLLPTEKSSDIRDNQHGIFARYGKNSFILSLNSWLYNFFLLGFVPFALLIIFGSYTTSKHLPVFVLSSFFFCSSFISFLIFYTQSFSFFFSFPYNTYIFHKKTLLFHFHVISTNHIHNKFITLLTYIYIYNFHN